MTAPFTNVKNSASISTAERSLPANTTTGVPTSQTTPVKVQIWLDVSALAAADTFELRVYEKVNGGTQHRLETITFSGVKGGQPDGLWSSDWIALSEGYDITLIRTAGADETIAWSLREDVSDVNLVSWLGTAPAALSSSGYVQSLLQRWLTDDAGGTPSALSSNKVQVILSSLANGSITAATFGANALGAVWDELLSGHTIASTFGKVLGTNIDATTSSRAQPSDVPSAATVATQVWGTVLEGTMTAADITRGILSGVMGVVSGFISGLEVFKDITGTKTRWTVQTAADGRTSVTKGDLS